METKITLTTSTAEGHTHTRFFPEGTIQAGTYETSEGGDDGHTHFFVVEDDVEPGSSVTVRTSPPNGEDEGHQHSITVRAVDDEASSDDEENSSDTRPKGRSAAIEIKRHGGHVMEVKQEVRNGVPVGIIAGYIATWDVDEGDDRFVQGAFADSIAEHRARNDRQVRFKDHHGRTIGGFPINTVIEDDVGLFGRGEVNLETQLGKEAFSLARQEVLVDFSVGFSALDFRFEDEIRIIEKALLWEGSIVDEPMNRAAQVTEVKKINRDELKTIDPNTLEEALRNGTCFSREAARALVSAFGAQLTEARKTRYDPAKLASVLQSLKDASESLKSE